MIREILYDCKIDQTRQPAMFRAAEGNDPRPLLVGLHTWSYDHTDHYEKFASICEQSNWNFIFPEFRGPNWRPEACGSDFVVSDLEDEVRYVCKTANVDKKRIYLCGGSGGGHCSLLLAGRRPDLWTAVSSWCPISDIRYWHEQCFAVNLRYYKHIESACGGNPETDAAARKQAMVRSPISWLANAAELPLAINCGIHDGHVGKGSVPVDQSIFAFNVLAAPEDRISWDDAMYMVKNEAVPEHLLCKEIDPAFGEHKVLFRRVSNNVRLTIFDGNHDLYEQAALEWLSRQIKGQPISWAPGPASAALDLDSSKLTS